MSKVSMAALCGAITLLVGFISARAESPATAPASRPTRVNPNKFQLPMTKTGYFSELGKKVNAGFNEMVHLMLDNREDIADSEKRKALLVRVKPVSEQLRSDARALAKQEGDVKAMTAVVDAVDAKSMEYLIILGDEETMQSLQADIDGPDIPKAMKARVQLLGRDWSLASDAQMQTDVVDALEKLVRAHPDSPELAQATYKLSGTAGQAERDDLHDRLTVLLADVMDKKVTGPYESVTRMVAANKAMRANVGKPFVLTGKTADGKNFSTADWKGKVILVDFWATWCGPCKAALPEIKQLYTDKHDQGLEIVSVSNDFSLADLQKFTADHNMPWPQLFDADAAAKQTWNPITLAHGVHGIPRIFVIDKQGNLVSPDARSTFKDLVTNALAQ